jgi:hypothetical protein
VQNGDDPDRRFVGSVGDQVVSNHDEPERTSRQIGAAVALPRESNEASNCLQQVPADPFGSGNVVSSDVFPDLGDIECGLRV